MIKILNVKVYDLETLTQEDLNKLALERNTLVKENQRLNNIINTFIELTELDFTVAGKDQFLEDDVYEAVTDTLERVLKRIKTLKEGK